MPGKISFSLLFTVLLISGCIFGDEDKSTDQTQTDSYFPLHAGMSRTFRFTETTLAGAILNSQTRTSVLSEETVYGGKEYWGVVEDSQPNGLFLRVENNIVYTLIPGEADSLVEIEYLKLDVAVGDQWETPIYSQFEPEHNALVTISMIGTYLGKKTVEVPAGTFEDCMKFDVSAIATIHSTEPVQVLHEQTEVWLARNIGIVKIRKTLLDQGNAAGYRVQELVSYQN